QVVSIYDSSACVYHAYQRSPAISGPTAFSLASGTCTQTTVIGDQYEPLGTELTLPALSPMSSTTRLSMGDVGFEGFRSTSSGAHDTRLDFDCFLFLHGADGKRRCLPPPFLQARSRIPTPTA